jgi:glycosyltransferase involved in cell wall biosynthesis
VKEGVPAEKMEIVPLVYEETVGGLPAERPAKEGLNLEILFLGQINLRKGMGRLLEAMRLLKDEPISLTLAGPSEIDPSAWGDLPRVKWVGVIPRSEVGKSYEAADLFILPTLSDGYALTQLEALAHGLPVLASRHCGEAVTHGGNGWVLPDLEPENIANAIRAAREALPLPKVEMPAFAMDDLAARLVPEGP